MSGQYYEDVNVEKLDDRPLSRRERAERTRARILDAALRLFQTQGYEATTMQAVAREAGVAVQTVYFVFGTKARLLAAIEPVAVAGSPAVSVRDQAWYAELRVARSGKEAVHVFVEAGAEVIGRIAAFVEQMGAALPMDPTTVSERERGRDEFFAALVDRLEALGALRPGLSAARANDILRAVLSIDAFVDLTTRRGWTVQEWIAWMSSLLSRELLASRDGV